MNVETTFCLNLNVKPLYDVYIQTGLNFKLSHITSQVPSYNDTGRNSTTECLKQKQKYSRLKVLKKEKPFKNTMLNIMSYLFYVYCKSLKYGMNIIKRNYGTALDSVI